VIACIRQKDGRYILHGTEFINLDSYKDRDEELIRNTEKILERAESFILQAPEQWSMYYPVWPQFIKDIL
jgi:lauroyl/myristoyl acyltransferase